jgi:hypothetical protein
MRKPIVRTAACCCAAAIACGITGCFPPPSYIDITQKGTIALVSFGMDKSISAVGGEKDTGPGLLQKMAKGREKSEQQYYRHHQASVDTMWGQYKERIRDAMLGVELVDFDTVMNSPAYQELTRHVPKIVMGSDIAPGADMLTPEKMNYVGTNETATLDQLAELFGADLLLLVSNTIDYDSTSAIVSVKVSRINVTANLALYEKGTGLVDQATFKGSSDERINLLLGTANPEKYEKGVASANRKVLDTIAAYFADQKDKARQQQALETAPAQ